MAADTVAATATNLLAHASSGYLYSFAFFRSAPKLFNSATTCSRTSGVTITVRNSLESALVWVSTRTLLGERQPRGLRDVMCREEHSPVSMAYDTRN